MVNGVRVRRIEREDLDFLVELANDPVVRANVVGWDFPLSLAGQQAWFDSQLRDARTIRFLVTLEDDTPIGMTGLWNIDWQNQTAETALKLGGAAQVRGKGYGTSAVRLMMEFAFQDVGIRKLTTSIIDGNEASLTTYVRKCGWVIEGRQTEQVWRDGSYRDLILIGILRSHYLEGSGRTGS